MTEMPPAGDVPRLKRVYQARDTVEAEFVRNLLEGQGIAATVHGANISSWLSPVMGSAVAPGVFVDEADLPAARELVRRYQQRDLPAGEPWTCPRCGEAIEGQFTQCWNCGAERDTQVDPVPAIPLPGNALDYRREDLPDEIDGDSDDVVEEDDPSDDPQ